MAGVEEETMRGLEEEVDETGLTATSPWTASTAMTRRRPTPRR